MLQLELDERGVIVPVRAQAGARRNGIIGMHDGMLRIFVTAVPEKGKANRAIIELLSAAIEVPKSAIELLSGETSPRKRFLIVGGDAAKVSGRLTQIIMTKK